MLPSRWVAIWSVGQCEASGEVFHRETSSKLSNHTAGRSWFEETGNWKTYLLGVLATVVEYHQNLNLFTGETC